MGRQVRIRGRSGTGRLHLRAAIRSTSGDQRKRRPAASLCAGAQRPDRTRVQPRYRACRITRAHSLDRRSPPVASTSEPIPLQFTYRLVRRIANPDPHVLNVLVVAFLANFVLLASYYILRPVRDAMATVFGVDQLQNLFTGTLVLTLIFSPAFAWLTDTFKLSRALPGVFWFIIANLLAFC